MNREIEYRGVCCDNDTINSGKMVYGHLIKIEKKYYIVEVLGEDSFIWNEVISETVGQYTGLKDKNSTKIYENDIVSVYRKERDITELAIVYWNKGYAAFLKEPIKNWEYTSWDEIEVVGNMTDNKDLITA